jgi:hypothetical protein
VDEDGRPIRTPISNRPPWLEARSPVGRHVFVGANAYMLELLADNREWAGIETSAAELLGRAALSDENLVAAADLVVAGVERVSGQLVVDVRVDNLTGHKLPTAYPSRRMWIHFEVLGAGDEVLWQSGATDARGVLVDGDGSPVEAIGTLLPHRDEIASESEVQVYQSVMGDAAGAVTSVLLDATQYLKDDRILPRGWAPSPADAALVAPQGVDGDADFTAGSDVVTYRVPASGAERIRVRLLYQSVPPLHVDALRDHPTPATARLIQMMETRPPLPREMAAVEQSF